MIQMMPLAILNWQPVVSIFQAPRAPDFRRLSRGWSSNDPAGAAGVQRDASNAYASITSAARRHHDGAAMDATFALQSIASTYQSVSNRLQGEFLRTDFETELIYGQSLARVEAGASAADLVILQNYIAAKGALGGAAKSAKDAIQANKDDSERQIAEILSGLREGFVTPLTRARSNCRERSRFARRKLREWKENKATNFPMDTDDLSVAIQNEAKRAIVPGLADDALEALQESTTNIVNRFTTNITAVRTDIKARVAPSLRAYTATMVEEGDEDVDEAFNKAFGNLKRQANQAREAIAESYAQIVAQLAQLRNAERERLQMLMQHTLEATHAEASAAVDLVTSTTESAMPHYSGATEQYADSISEAARQSAASLSNIAGTGAEDIRTTIAGAHDLQQSQLDMAASGNANSLHTREIQVRTELAALIASASQNLQGTVTTGTADMMTSAEAMTKGLDALSAGVTAAAQQWLRPLSEAFKDFLDGVKDDLDDGKPAFLQRVGEAESDFLSYATRQATPAQLFARQLLSAATAAMQRARDTRSNLVASLDDGVIDVVNERGVGNALRGLTARQGRWVRQNWPFSSSRWPPTIPEGLERRIYEDITGTEEYTLTGHLAFALGPGSDDYNAAINYLSGNTAAGARYELEASVHWYNDEEERIENIQKSLTQEQLRQLRGMDEYQQGTRDRLRGALDGTDLNVYDALEVGDHARAEAHRMLDSLNTARDQHEIDKTNDILGEYSTATTWGGESVSGAERRAAVHLALAEIRGTSREELEARAAEQNREREAAARQQAEAREQQARDAPAPPSGPTSDENIQRCVEPPAETGNATIEPQQLESRLPDADATSTSVPATSTSESEGGTSEQEQPQSLADRWMQPQAPEPPTITAASLAGEMLFEYATRPILQVHQGRGHTYTMEVPEGYTPDRRDPYVRTLSMSDRERDLARALIFHGEGSPEARAARLGVEVQRSGKPNIVNVDRALVDPRLNPDSLAAIEDPTVRQRVEDNAEADRQRMLAIFARDYGGLDGGTSTEHTDILVGQLEAAFGSDTAGAELAGLMVRDEYPSPQTAAKAVEYAVEGAGTNNELYFRVTERMNREDFQTMRAQYKENTGREMYADLGLFGHGWFGDLSGDDRLRAERGTLGQPRNDRERAEVAAFAIQQQRDETGWLGTALASGSMQDVMLDVEEAELNALVGGPIEFGPEAEPIWTDTSNFDANDNFTGDVAAFRATAESAQLSARNYSAKVDSYANFAATTIAVIGAVVAAVVTVLTGGAASPLLLASIALITGLTAMGVQHAIKGGRYGWEQAVTDLGMTAVQALTAGVGQGLALASRGGMAGLQAGMKAGLSMSAARELARGGLLGQMGRLSGSAFMDKLLIGMGTGALGSVGGAALDEQTYAGGKGVENLFAAAFRGMLSGGVTAGVSNAIEDVPLGRLSKLVGDRTLGDAIGSTTNVLGRGVGKGVSSGLGAFAGRAAELGFESSRGTYQGDAGDIFVESAKAGGMSLLQGVGEGAAEARAQAIFNARYGGKSPVDTELELAREADAAEARQAQIDAEAESRARAPDADEAERPGGPMPDDDTARPTPDAELDAAGRRPEDMEGPERMPADADAEQRRRAELDEAQQARRDQEMGEIESEAGSRAFTDDADVIDLDQARQALAEIARAPDTEDAAAPAKAGAAAEIERSQMTLLADPIEIQPGMLRDAAGDAVGRVRSLAGTEISTGGDGELRVQLTRADGSEISVKVEFGDTTGGDVASFRLADPGDDVQFVVTLSNRAHPEVHARAIGHELAEIRVHGIKGAAAESDLLTTTVRPGDDARLSAHDVGRLAELDVLSAELAAARAIPDDAADPVARRRKSDTVRRLESEIDTLGRHLGLTHDNDQDIRLRSALTALREDSPAAAMVGEARERSNVLGRARAIDAETRLTAADLVKLGELDRLADAMETAQSSDDRKARIKARRELEDALDGLGLNDSDSASEQRVRLAMEALGEDSPAARVLSQSDRRTRRTHLNDALRPGLTPDDATVLSSRDIENIGELTDALRALRSAESPPPAPAEMIESRRHRAEAQAAEMGLVFGDEAATARARFLETRLPESDLPLVSTLETVRDSAQRSALLKPRSGAIEDLPLLAAQIAEARAMGDMELVSRLIEIAGLHIEQAGMFDPNDAVQQGANDHIARVIRDNEGGLQDNGDAAHHLAVDASRRHRQRLRAQSIEQELDSLRVSIDEVVRQIPAAEDGDTRTRLQEDREALVLRQERLQAELAEAQRIAFRPPDTTEADARAAVGDPTFRTRPLMRHVPEFAGSAEQIRLTRQRYGDSPMFQSWDRFKQLYQELHPSVHATSVRSNTHRDSTDVIDALVQERLFGYWRSGRYVTEDAPLGRSLPDLTFIPAGKGDPVDFTDPATGARATLDTSTDPLTIKNEPDMTPNQAAAERRNLMHQRNIKQAHLDLETDPAKQAQLRTEVNELAQRIRNISESLGEAAGVRFAATLDGGSTPPIVDQGQGTTDVVHIDPVSGRVSVIECKGGTSQLGSRIAEVDGRRVRAEQTTPEYIRSLANDMLGNPDTEATGRAILHALENDPPGIDSYVVRQPYDSNGNLGPIEVTKYPVTRSGR